MTRPIPRRRIPENFVHMLYEYLDARGEAAKQVLTVARPQPEAHGLGSFPIEAWIELLERAAEHLNDPFLGLRLGQTVTPRHLGVLGYLLLASSHLAHALQRLEHYQRLIYDVTPMVMREVDGQLELIWDAEHGRPGSLVDETAITALVQFCRVLCGRLSPLAVHFINTPPTDLTLYTDFFGCPVHFERPATVLRFDEETLSLPLRTANPAMLQMMEQQADALLSSLSDETTLLDQVRRCIGRALHEGEPNIDTVAAKLDCTTRTLQRKLKQAGSCFRDELATVRRQMAESYLSSTRLGIVDIALLLGYSEHSAFSRSFASWTGMSPREYRRMR